MALCGRRTQTLIQSSADRNPARVAVPVLPRACRLAPPGSGGWDSEVDNDPVFQTLQIC